MARVAPLLSSSSALFLMLSPIVLTMLIASWPTPAVEARFLQAHDEPQWMQEIHKSPVEDKLPFEVRMRRSPQEPEAAEPEQSKPGFWKKMMTKTKEFFKKVLAVFGQIMKEFSGNNGNGAGGNEANIRNGEAEEMSPDHIHNEQLNDS